MGVSLYEAVTLDLPFVGDTDEAYIGAVSMRQPVPARVAPSHQRAHHA